MQSWHRAFNHMATGVLIASFMFGNIAYADYVPASTPYATRALIDSQTHAMAWAQAASQAAANPITGQPQIDVSLYSCMNKFSQAFSGVLSISNPRDILKKAAQAAAIQAIGQVCNIGLGVVNQVKNSVTSIFNLACLPLPDLSVNASLNLQLPTLNCNGVNLLKPAISAAPPNSPPGYWQLWLRPY